MLKLIVDNTGKPGPDDFILVHHSGGTFLIAITTCGGYVVFKDPDLENLDIKDAIGNYDSERDAVLSII